MISREYEKLRSQSNMSSIMDKERIFSDLRRQQGALQSILKNYQSIRLDVVSLAETRETLANAPTSSVFDERL